MKMMMLLLKELSGEWRNCGIALIIGATLLIFAHDLEGQALGQGTTLPSSGQSASGTTSSSSAGLSKVPVDFSKLRMGPGFEVALNVYDASDLSGTYRIDDDGNITLPLVGLVHLAGLTLHAAESLIDDTFQSHEILIHPQVTLDIVQYAPFLVDVTGEVQKPGNIELQAPRSLLAILAEAGGLTDAAGSMVQITHNADGVRKTDSYPYSKGSNGDSIHDVLVYSGDTIVVPRAGIVYVLGAVGRPGGYVMQEHGKLDVAQALALALGTLPTAAVQSTRVIRRNPDGSILDFSIDYKAISEGKQVPVSLQAEDIVYVPVSKVKTFFTSSAGIIGTAATTTVYAVK